MLEESFAKIINVVFEEHLFSIILHFALVYISVFLVKSMAGTIIQYILLKTGLFGIGSVVEYNGHRGVITSIGLRWIAINFDDKKMFIHTTEQHKMHLVIPTNKDKTNSP